MYEYGILKNVWRDARCKTVRISGVNKTTAMQIWVQRRCCWTRRCATTVCRDTIQFPALITENSLTRTTGQISLYKYTELTGHYVEIDPKEHSLLKYKERHILSSKIMRVAVRKSELFRLLSLHLNFTRRIRVGADDYGTSLQAGRPRVRFPVGSLGFFIDIILPAAMWLWGRLGLWLPGISPGR